MDPYRRPKTLRLRPAVAGVLGLIIAALGRPAPTDSSRRAPPFW
jgi:hypothetical protein